MNASTISNPDQHESHTPVDTSRFPLTFRNGSSIFLISLASLMMANLAPFIMTALGHLGFDILTQGNILTCALLASAVVGLGTARWASGRLRRPLAAVGLAIATIAFSLATVVSEPALAVAGLIAGGAGIGTAISTSGAALAALRNPNRVSAASALVNRICITAILAMIPAFGISQGSVFGTLAGISLVGLILVVWLPGTPPHAEPVALESKPDSRIIGSTPKPIFVAGIAILFIFPLWGTSEDAIWTMAPVLGSAVGLDETATGFALSLAGAGGILGVLMVTILGNRIGRALPLSISLVLGGGAKIAIAFTNDPMVLAGLIITINMIYAFAFALYLATAAGLDARGRWSGPLLGAYLVGSSFAPFIGSALIDSVGIPTYAIIMGIVSFVVIAPTVAIARVSVAAEHAHALALEG